MNVLALNIPQDVKNDILTVADTLLEKFSSNISKIILFGSYATCKYQPDSDIDLAVVLNQMPDIKDRRLYKQAIDMEREIDLLFCTKEQLASDALVYKWVNQEGVVVYEQL